ncbi:ketoacyl-ACP synthase III [Alistipes communis]|jgi:putative 3-oxoacyl-(acyl-carrier-protein) synthase III|uniref:3-oxoacyl-ACP synthase III family protein n=1 Tax=Alistipes communis TaxID=2585118 RepID=UPI001D07E011|nr:ketoacyl-ACP synthase III [Alistipes communis]MCB6994848.1 ketoacyl-ACP synthase III [Alistipes communis]
MSFLKFQGVGITALSGAVPRTVIDNYKYTQYFPEDQVREVVDKVGIYERRFADEKTCSSDLCFAAAEKLIADNGIDRSEIDLLIFISQTPDYRMPATSVLLQERLDLPNSTIAFDINLGCSAFIYGLSVAYSFMQCNNLRKALVLDGETRSKVYSPKDRRSAFLFGDGGVAALVERDEKFGTSFFSLNSDGSRGDLIKINAGGYRMPSSVETLKEKVVDEYGNIRSEEQGYMNGSDVFNFVIREIPRDIKKIVEWSGVDIQELDYYVFHQANNFINSYLAKKLKLDTTKIPSTIAKYGNTSSVSVPLTIVDQLKDNLSGKKQLMLSAFGVGMTWATAIVSFVDCRISDIVEV